MAQRFNLSLAQLEAVSATGAGKLLSSASFGGVDVQEVRIISTHASLQAVPY